MIQKGGAGIENLFFCRCLNQLSLGLLGKQVKCSSVPRKGNTSST